MGKRILTLQDFSSVGRCSLSAAIPILSALSHEAVALPTALLSTQTSDIDGFTFVDLSDNILPAFEHWKSLSLDFDCLYCGFLGTVAAIENAEKIVSELKEKNTLIVIDPAMADNGKLYDVFDNKYFEKMRALSKKADILLPNFTEAKLLADLNIPLVPNKENADMILRILDNNGYKCVVLSGIIDDNECGCALLKNSSITFQTNSYFHDEFHGTGDILSSVIVGKLLLGKSLNDATQAAVDFILEAIKVSIDSNFDKRYGLHFEKVLSKLL